MNTFLGSILGILSLFSGPKTATLNEIALPDFRTGKAISYVAFDKILKEQEAARATFQVHFPGKGGSVLTYVVSPDEAVPAVHLHRLDPANVVVAAKYSRTFLVLSPALHTSLLLRPRLI